MSFNKVKFELDTLTCGVTEGRFRGYSIPVLICNETATKIKSLCKERGAQTSLCGTTLYLKSQNLSEKQKNELLNKGRSPVLIHFKVSGTYTTDNTNYLVFKVTKLCKLNKPESKNKDKCPED